MTTLTIKINERSKAGKAFLAMTETFFKDAKGIEVIEAEQLNKSPYNASFVAKIKKAEKRGKYKTIDTNDVWGSLGLKT